MDTVKKVQCPCCLGSKQFMEAKPTKGFKYNECKVCDDDGLVEKEIADDIILSQNEDSVEFDEYD